MNIPTCRREGCPKSQTVILKEDNEAWVFGCLGCKSVWIFSKPQAVERAQYENEVKARTRQATEREKKLFALRAI